MGENTWWLRTKENFHHVLDPLTDSDWNFYGQKEFLTIEDVVAISLNIHPNNFNKKVRVDEYDSIPATMFEDFIPREYYIRLEIAETGISNGKLKINNETEMVSVYDFGAWAKAEPLNWELPESFPKQKLNTSSVEIESRRNELCTLIKKDIPKANNIKLRNALSWGLQYLEGKSGANAYRDIKASPSMDNDSAKTGGSKCKKAFVQWAKENGVDDIAILRKTSRK